MYFFTNLEPVCCSNSSSNFCFLTCIQVSQEAGKVVWYSYLFKNFQNLLWFTVKSCSVINEAEIDVFLEFSWFFNDPTNVGNLISGSSSFSKSSLYIWKFSVHILVKPGLENFEHYFASIWDECNCVIIWTFYSIAFLWDGNESWPFPVLWPLLSFPNLLAYWASTFTASFFRIWNSSTVIPSPPPALFVVILPKALSTSYSRRSGSRWAITSLWLSRSLRYFFIQLFCVSLPPLLIIFYFC